MQPKRSSSSTLGRSRRAILAFAVNSPGSQKTRQPSTKRCRPSSQRLKAYSYKEIGDYRVGQGAIVSDAEAKDAIEAAAHFVERITAMLTMPL